MKKVYAFNQDKVFIGEVQLGPDDLSPLEQGVYLVPAGCVESAPPAHTESEYAEFVSGTWVIKTIPIAEPLPEPIPTAPTPLELLDKLDADNTLTQRNLRETVMLMAEAFKQVTAGAVDLSTIPGVAKVYEVEAQAAVLRGQL